MKIATIQKHVLDFKFNAGTSRGILTQKETYFLRIIDSDNGMIGIGECSTLKGLSCDAIPEYESILQTIVNEYNSTQIWNIPLTFPSIIFGMETAMARFNSTHKWVNFNQDFVINQVKIPINGLIWMGTKEFMYEQIKKKIEEGYSCLKMKVGAIDFELELELLKYIRSQFSENEMTLRVDANGAFMENTLEKLSRISEYQIHSIEQPIMKGDWEKMAYLVDKSPIDIALDEELIGINDSETKRKLLETIKPRYIILKPSLHGGYAGSQEWINLSNENNCAWWLTSALESNVGLNAISQMAALWAPTTLHGLGTGQLYHVNVDPVLEVKSGFIQFGKNE